MDILGLILFYCFIVSILLSFILCIFRMFVK